MQRAEKVLQRVTVWLIRKSWVGLALPSFKARVFLVNDVDLTLAAHDLVGFVTALQALQRRCNFHNNLSNGGVV